MQRTVTSPERTVAAEPPALKPSGAIRLLWWCLILAPVAGVLIVMLPPLLLVLAGAAFVVAVDSVTDRHLTLEQRLIGLLLVVAVFPAGILGIFIIGSLGFLNEGPTATDRFLTFAASVVWVLALLAVKPRAWKILKKNEWKP